MMVVLLAAVVRLMMVLLLRLLLRLVLHQNRGRGLALTTTAAALRTVYANERNATVFVWRRRRARADNRALGAGDFLFHRHTTAKSTYWQPLSDMQRNPCSYPQTQFFRSRFRAHPNTRHNACDN